MINQTRHRARIHRRSVRTDLGERLVRWAPASMNGSLVSCLQTIISNGVGASIAGWRAAYRQIGSQLASKVGTCSGPSQRFARCWWEVARRRRSRRLQRTDEAHSTFELGSATYYIGTFGDQSPVPPFSTGVVSGMVRRACSN